MHAALNRTLCCMLHSTEHCAACCIQQNIVLHAAFNRTSCCMLHSTEHRAACRIKQNTVMLAAKTKNSVHQNPVEYKTFTRLNNSTQISIQAETSSSHPLFLVQILSLSKLRKQEKFEFCEGELFNLKAPYSQQILIQH